MPASIKINGVVSTEERVPYGQAFALLNDDLTDVVSQTWKLVGYEQQRSVTDPDAAPVPPDFATLFPAWTFNPVDKSLSITQAGPFPAVGGPPDVSGRWYVTLTVAHGAAPAAEDSAILEVAGRLTDQYPPAPKETVQHGVFGWSDNRNREILSNAARFGWIRVHNDSGAPIVAGKVVKIGGVVDFRTVDGNAIPAGGTTEEEPIFTIAVGNSDDADAPDQIYGVVKADIADDAPGWIQLFGRHAMDLTGHTEGAKAFLNTTGDIVNAPIGNEIVALGTVIENGATGHLYFNGMGGGGNGLSGIPFITLTNTGSLGAERALSGGAGISLVDNGPNSTLVINNDLSTGVAGGQSVIGGLAAGESLTLVGSSHGSKGPVIVDATLAQFPAGVVGAPSLNFGDATTGLFRPALDQVGVTIAGVLSANFFVNELELSGGLTMTDNAAVPISAANQAAIRSNGGVLEFSEGTSAWAPLSDGSTLTDMQIGFGDAANKMTSEAALSYIAATNTMNVDKVRLAAGDVTSVAIGPQGDPNNGVIYPADDTQAWVAGGIERMRLANNVLTLPSGALVGIGLATPEASLDVAGLIAVRGSGGITSGTAMQIDWHPGNVEGRIFALTTGVGFRPLAAYAENYEINIGIGTTVLKAQFDGQGFGMALNGTAAAPAIYRVGDTNTGWFFPVADTQAWSTGGVERMRLTTTGLGIGNTPEAPVALDVAGSMVVRGLGSILTTSGLQIEYDSGSFQARLISIRPGVAFTATQIQALSLSIEVGAAAVSQVALFEPQGLGISLNGTAAAPAIYRVGDENNGKFFPAADTQAWSTAGAERLRIDGGGNFTYAQGAIATGSPNFQKYTPGAHTNLTLSVQASDVIYNLDRTVQFATGALTKQAAFLIKAPTYAFVAASTMETGAVVEIQGTVIAGTNATITHPTGLLLSESPTPDSEEWSMILRGVGTNARWGGILLQSEFSSDSILHEAARIFGDHQDTEGAYLRSDLHIRSPGQIHNEAGLHNFRATNGGAVTVVNLGGAGSSLGAMGATPITRPSVTGARDETEGAQVSLLSQLEALGLITDNTTAS